MSPLLSISKVDDSFQSSISRQQQNQIISNKKRDQKFISPNEEDLSISEYIQSFSWKLSSYASNIYRSRQKQEPGNLSKFKPNQNSISSPSSSSSRSQSIIRSLVHTLANERDISTLLLPFDASPTQQQQQQQQVSELSKNLTKACTQAIRTAADCNDYVLIGRVAEASLAYATFFSNEVATLSLESSDGSHNVTLPPIFDPRILGEAIDGLSRTSAGASKLRKIWSLLDNANNNNHTAILTRPPGPRELNAMIIGLFSKGKLRAALDFPTSTKKSHHQIVGDAYTASTLFTILADSIRDDNDDIIHTLQKNKDTNIIPKAALFSPCWQWNEAQKILDEYSGTNHHATQTRLNNHAYAAALRVNERASKVFGTYHNYSDRQHYLRPHSGATVAMDILKQMKDDGISPDVVTCSSVLAALDHGRQWKAAVSLLDAMERSTISKNKEGGSQWILPSPNVYSYASAISACARCGELEAALSILDGMITTTKENSDDLDETVSIIRPNTWVYNAALAACVEGGKRREYKEEHWDNDGDDIDEDSDLAKSQRRRRHSDHTHKHDIDGQRIRTALSLLRRMESDAQNGYDTAPDTVSYNTALSAMDGLYSTAQRDKDGTAIFDFVDGTDDIVMDLLHRMNLAKVPRDVVTYRNAIGACRSNPNAAIRTLKVALNDEEFLHKTNQKSSSQQKGLNSIANAALSVCSHVGADFTSTMEVLALMKQFQIVPNAASFIHWITALSRSNRFEDILLILRAIMGDVDASQLVIEKYHIAISAGDKESMTTSSVEDIFSSAIISCLRKNEVNTANDILNLMRQHKNMKPNQRALERVVVAYSQLAMNLAKEEFKVARKQRQSFSMKNPFLLRPQHTQSSTRALAALAIADTFLIDLPHRRPDLMSIIAQACAASGLWLEARTIVHSLHDIVAITTEQETTTINASISASCTIDVPSTIITPNERRVLMELPHLHRQLLTLAARAGNITAALWYGNEIHSLEAQLNSTHYHFSSDPVPSSSNLLLHDIFDQTQDGDDDEQALEHLSGSFPLAMSLVMEDNDEEEHQSPKTSSASLIRSSIGMKAEDWKLLTIAASKAGQWKLCLRFLQCLRPFVERTHVRLYDSSDMLSSSSSSSSSSLPDHSNRHALTKKTLDRRYGRIEQALIASMRCFEHCGQDTWAIRVMDDWIKWSGRRPNKEAVISASRTLADNGQGDDVISLISRVLDVLPAGKKTNSANNSITKTSSIFQYERAIYIESITTLYNNGMYDNADDLYVMAVSKGYLPWAITEMAETSAELILDLHGMTTAIAHSAVRVSLQREIQSSMTWDNPSNTPTSSTSETKHEDEEEKESETRQQKIVTIITGRGKRSAMRLRPVLRPEVQRMLLEEFYPPLGTTSVPGNMGALRINPDNLHDWLLYQKQQKGARLLAVATVLKNLSPATFLQRSLLLKSRFGKKQERKRNPQTREQKSET